MVTKQKRHLAVVKPVFATALLLLIPLIAMQFTEEVIWNIADFVVAGTLLFGTGFTYQLLTNKSKEITYRVAVGLALLSGFFLIWVNLAVGIIGAENNPFSTIYFGPIAMGLLGAFVSRFKSRGMSLTMLGMALFVVLIVLGTLFSGMHHVTGSSVLEIITINGLFVTLFLISALLFWHTARQISDSNQLVR
jgi:hypothetical protein